MSDASASAREDLAFLRGLVDEDWRPGMWAFGAIYVTIGLAIFAHMVISWLDDSGVVPLEGWSYLVAMLVLYGGFSVLWTWIWFSSMRKVSAAQATSGVKNRAGGAAFGSAMLAHLVMLAVCIIVAARRGETVFLQLAPLVLFVLQGVVWFVVHAMRRRAWQLWEALGWFAAALAIAPLVGTGAFAFGIALAAIVLMIVPGAYMMRLAKAA